MSSRRSRFNDFEEHDMYPPPRREREEVDVLLRERERDRGVSFLRDEGRRVEAGPMVLRQRDIETIDRHRRSPSPVRVREEVRIRRPRSVSPHYDHERERTRSRTRVVERELVRRSPSPRPIRFVERRRSPSPTERERIRARIVERAPSSSSSSSEAASEPPKVIRGPTIEREVITHYRDIDHGVIRARQPSPPPPPRSRVRERETDIDIQLSKNRTEVDVDIKSSSSRTRSRSRERRRPTVADSLSVDYSRSSRRSQSAAPTRSPDIEEANYITGKIDSRGRIGEAYHGATKDWAIVDVPPGTERIRMDGVGGASTDTTFSKYSGVRRTKFIPEGQDAIEPRRPSPSTEKDRTSVTVYDREREVDIERTVERRTPRPAKSKDMWTEISKDLVSREAIEYMGYEYEDTPMFFYIMDYLRYDDVLYLTELTEDMRCWRKSRVREIEWEHDWRDEWERHRHHIRPRDDERWVEREVIYDNRRPFYR